MNRPFARAQLLAWLAGPVLAVAAFVAYWPGLSGPFLMDDFDAIFPIAAHQSSGAGWVDILANAPSHVRDRLVSNASFLLTQELSGSAMPPEAFHYKLGNLLIHLACAVALYLLAVRLLGRVVDEPLRRMVGALTAAAVFLLHPFLLSTVLYPVQRMAQLATLFALLAVLAYVRWREALANSSSSASLVRIIMVLGLVALAFLSKENGALAVGLIGVVEFALFRPPPKHSPERPKWELGFGLACAGPLVLGLVLFLARWDTTLAGYARRDFSMTERLLTQVHVLWSYLQRIVWPDIRTMGLYADGFPVTRQADALTVFAALGILAILVVALLLRRRWPMATVGLLWFFVAHAMESTFIGLELVFEHRNYLALPGLCMLLGWLAARVGARASAIGAVALALVLGTATHLRAGAWADYGSWIAQEYRNQPDSLRAGTDYAAFLLEQGKADAAESVIRTLSNRFPGHAQPVLMRTWALCRNPGAEQPQVGALSTARMNKDTFHLYSALVGRKTAGACPGVDWTLLAEVSGAIATNPLASRSRSASAAWNREHARALAQAGRWREAEEALQRCVAAQSNYPPDWLDLMRVNLELGHVQGYFHARNRLLRLLPSGLGHLSTPFHDLEQRANTRWSETEHSK